MLSSILGLSSCEEVVEVDLEQSAERLVINANIFHIKGIPSSFQIITLSLTAPFFDNEVPPATGAIVIVRDDHGNIFPFEEEEPGLYQNEDFTPLPDIDYFLEINYREEVYSATETFIPVVDLEYVEQNNEGGFFGEDIELQAFYTDPPERGNYYYFRFLHDELSLQIYDDEFINGNQTFAFYSNEDLQRGDIVTFEIQGISRRFYEYMFILRSQAGSGGGPFQTQPTTVRGNVINTTNPENFPFGYFRLSEVDRIHYTVQ